MNRKIIINKDSFIKTYFPAWKKIYIIYIFDPQCTITTKEHARVNGAILFLPHPSKEKNTKNELCLDLFDQITENCNQVDYKFIKQFFFIKIWLFKLMALKC